MQILEDEIGKSESTGKLGRVPGWGADQTVIPGEPEVRLAPFLQGDLHQELGVFENGRHHPSILPIGA